MKMKKNLLYLTHFKVFYQLFAHFALPKFSGNPDQPNLEKFCG